MIARLINVERAYTEMREAEVDCVEIKPERDKGSFGKREKVTTEEAIAFARQVHADFQGEYILEAWKSGSKDERIKYVVNTQQTAQVAGMGNGNMGTVLQLMQTNFDKQLEIERLKMQQQQQQGPDYFQQGLAMFAQMMTGRMPAPAPPPAQVTGHQEHGANGHDREEEEENDESDVLDNFIDADPEAEEIIERLIRLKKENPAMYEQAKQMLPK